MEKFWSTVFTILIMLLQKYSFIKEGEKQNKQRQIKLISGSFILLYKYILLETMLFMEIYSLFLWDIL